MSPHEQHILDRMLVEARVMMMDGSPLELEPSQFSDCVTSLIGRLREAERDAARMNWLESNGFSIEMADYNHISCNRAAIDQAMKGEGDE